MKLRTVAAVVVGFAAVGVVVLATACNSNGLPEPTYVVETTVGSDTWTEVDALPGWIEDPPQREGYLRFVVNGKSNLRGIVTQIGGPMPRPEVENYVNAHLAPVVGADAAAVAAKAAYDARVLVERASKDEVLTRDMVPGNTLSTVYALWEIAIDDVVAAIAESDRADARAALQ